MESSTNLSSEGPSLDDFSPSREGAGEVDVGFLYWPQLPRRTKNRIGREMQLTEFASIQAFRPSALI